MAFNTHLRRGLVLSCLFAARFAAAAPETSSDGSTVTSELTLPNFDKTVVAGKPETIGISITKWTTGPGYSECSDDFAGEGWGCGGGKPCGSHQWVTPSPTASYESGTLVKATCDDDCDVSIIDNTLHFTGKTAGKTALLQVDATDSSGVLVSGRFTIAITDDKLHVGRYANTLQTPDNAFLVGQTFAWCVIGRGKAIAEYTAIATAFGAVRKSGERPEAGCDSFVTTAVGTGHIVFTSNDGAELTVDAVTVSPNDVVAIDFIDVPEPYAAYPISTTELLSKAHVFDQIPVNYDGSVCRTVAARFKTADGRYGLLPASVMERNAAGGRTATIGAVTKSIPTWTTSCY